MIPDFQWPRLLGMQLWQLTLVILAVGFAVKLCRRSHPHLAYVLWLVVLVKAVTPPLWVSNLSLLGNVPTPSLSSILTPLELPPAKKSLAQPEALAANGSLRNIEPIASSFGGATATIDWVGLGIGIWFFGAAVLASVSVMIVTRRNRLLQQTRIQGNDSLEQEVEQIAVRLGVRRRVQVVVSSSGLGPALCGLWRPKLILPQCILDEATPADRDAIITHELVHLRRGDHLATALQCAVQIIWWFHPLVWWANRQIGILRERCCDQESIRAFTGSPSSYADCLLKVLSAKEKVQPVYGVPGVRPIHVTAFRIKEIMTMSNTFQVRTPVWCWCTALLAAVLVLPGVYVGESTPATAQESKATADSSPSAVDAKGKPSNSKKLMLKYGDNRPDGKKSIAGTGEMIRFELPGEVGRIRAIKVHGSRYGYPQPPKEDIEVTLLSEDMTETLHTELVPYSLFKKLKKARWTFVPFKEPIDLPKVFWVVLNFNAERTKGVYVSYDTSTKGVHSRVGTNEEDAQETKFGGDWMVQVLLAK